MDRGGDAANVVRQVNAVPDSVLAMADGLLVAEPAGERFSRLHFCWGGCMVACADVSRAWLAQCWVWVSEMDPFQLLPPLRESLVSGAPTVLWAFIGRMVWHIDRVRYGHRRFYSVHLLWELGVAVGIGLVGDGLATWLDITGKPVIALTVAVAHIGPGGFEHAIPRYLARRVPPEA